MESTDTPVPDPGSIAGVAARLTLWGQRAPKGLARVEFSSDLSRRAVDDAVRAACDAAGIPFFSLELPRQTLAADIVVWLEEQFAPLPHGIVSITGWATAFSPDVPLEEALRVLNYNRETLAQFPLCQIWWLPHTLASEFSVRIPDLNSWFIVRLHLTENIVAPQEESEQDAPFFASPERQEAARKSADALAQRFQNVLEGDTPLPEMASLANAAVKVLREVGLSFEAQGLSEQLVTQIVTLPLYQGVQSGEVKLSDIDAADFYFTIANLYKAQLDFKQASDALQYSLSTTERLHGPESEKVALLLNELGIVWKEQGYFAEAEPLYQRALAIWESCMGREHPNIATTLNNLAGLYGSQGRYAEAEPLLLQALAIDEKVYRVEHPNIAITINNLANLYGSQSRFTEAESLYQRALGITEIALGLEHPRYALVLGNYASLLRETGRTEEANALVARMEGIRAKH